ncbi:MAG TPA: glycosyltransferase family 4 protein [Longimicrobium sp.]|nr:glycosyltransferase family 4 protein [Longimicrobium sp.]
MSAELSRRPRLLLVATELPPGPGGLGTHAHELALGLSRRGWEVRVLAPQAYVGAEERARFNAAQPYRVGTLEGGSVARRLRAFARLLAGWRPDVVVGSGSRALWAARVVAALLRAPLVAVAHGSEIIPPERAKRRLTVGALRAADAVISVSRYTAGLVRETAGPPRREVVIPNGADGERFHPGLDAGALRERLGLAGRRVILTVGRVCERKAQDVVIRALPEVARRVPGAVYLMAGLPERQRELAALAEELAVADRVRFAGPVPAAELPLYFNLADVFILPSRRARDGDVEGYGIAAVEAGLCGVPAVVSDSGGLPEAVRDGETGIVVPTDDPAATAGALLRLLEDEPAREGTWAHRMAEYDRVLREVAGW